MPKNIREWVTLIALAIGIAAAIADVRPLAAFCFLVTIVFGIAAAKITRNVNRYRL